MLLRMQAQRHARVLKHWQQLPAAMHPSTVEQRLTKGRQQDGSQPKHALSYSKGGGATQCWNQMDKFPEKEAYSYRCHDLSGRGKASQTVLHPCCALAAAPGPRLLLTSDRMAAAGPGCCAVGEGGSQCSRC